MNWRILFVSLLMVTGTFGLFLWERLSGSDIDTARTVAVNTLVVAEVFYLFNTRYLTAPVLNRAFSPGEQEVDEARRIVEAYDAALLRGQGSITVGGRMVDVPVAERARRLLARAARVREIAESRHSGVDP